MGLNLAQNVTGQMDNYIGPGLSAVWIGVLGLALMATGLSFTICQRLLETSNHPRNSAWIETY